MIDKRLAHPEVKYWFEHKWTLYNECSILSRNPETGVLEEHRPDRVMKSDDEVIVVDFKFGSPKDTHIRQVQQYMSLLTSMGLPQVKGYLWYFYSNRIESVCL